MKLPFQNVEYSGKLIVVCGTDGSGKSTAVNALASAFRERGHRVVTTREPTNWWREQPRVKRTLYGEGNCEPLSHPALALLAVADRRDHHDRFLRPMLESGAVVISDRYIYSLFAYYMAAGGVDLSWLAQCSSFVMRPDVAILLDLPAEVAVERVIRRDGPAGDFDQNPAFVTKFIQAYGALAASNGMVRVDSSADPELMARRCVEAATAALDRRGRVAPATPGTRASDQ